jgi:hypothetical protein
LDRRGRCSSQGYAGDTDNATQAEIETWMTAPAEVAMKLQRPLPDGTLKIVARGEGGWGPAILQHEHHRSVRTIYNLDYLRGAEPWQSERLHKPLPFDCGTCAACH